MTWLAGNYLKSTIKEHELADPNAVGILVISPVYLKKPGDFAQYNSSPVMPDTVSPISNETSHCGYIISETRYILKIKKFSHQSA